MKIKFLPWCIPVLLLLCFNIGYANDINLGNDTNEVKRINLAAFNNRLTDPSQTVLQGKKALVMATKLNYVNGIAEANRELGIGFYYLGKPDSAINYYLTAKKIYDDNGDKIGQARVLNNIGNLYHETDYDQSIKYFNETLNVAKDLHDEDLMATAYLNLGNTYNSKKNFHTALDYYNKSKDIFTKRKREVYVIQCIQNRGVVYFELRQLDTAKTLLLQAHQEAKVHDLNSTIAGINITLVRIFMAEKQFDKADQYWDEGLAFSKQLDNANLINDYKLLRYSILLARKDYKGALDNLIEIYKRDSTLYSTNESTRLNLLDAQYKQNEKDQKNQRTIEEQKYNRSLFFASSIVAALLAVVIFLLVNSVNRKAKVNKHLTELNEQISVQKENLNQINHHLEEIIDERTKDLQVKNKKLADYSLHLSHQIRGPIATLKGLLNLERDKLIEQDECIKLMNKCVSDIDENIIDMSGMLHESSKTVVNKSKPKV